MKKILLVTLLFSFLNIQSANAKTINWKYEVISSQQNKLEECIKVVEIKGKPKGSDILVNFLHREVPFLVKLQNKCKEGIKGSFKIKLLDEDEFLVRETTEDFSIGRKGLSKTSFKILFEPYNQFKKVKSVSIEFQLLETF
jgi:hypothetical protein